MTDTAHKKAWEAAENIIMAEGTDGTEDACKVYLRTLLDDPAISTESDKIVNERLAAGDRPTSKLQYEAVIEAIKRIADIS